MDGDKGFLELSMSDLDFVMLILHELERLSLMPEIGMAMTVTYKAVNKIICEFRQEKPERFADIVRDIYELEEKTQTISI